ncbi:MAG: hypothetical protein NZ959_09790 [Armatimonadetes bacterium]|nr:hypothetical protein [Armatimonadota bacterium]MDW8122657.1 hypothetical protein [Armatimonadota bacterium]
MSKKIVKITAGILCCFALMMGTMVGQTDGSTSGSAPGGSRRQEKSAKRVTLELTNAPVTDAIEQLFRAAGENFVLIHEPSTTVRLTLRLVDVPFEETLGYLCSLAGLTWRVQEGVYIIERRGATGGATVLPGAPGGPVLTPIVPPLGVPSIAMGGVLAPSLSGLFCPRCGFFSVNKCEKCGRTGLDEWRFCPYDGTRYPERPTQCPQCKGDLLRSPSGVGGPIGGIFSIPTAPQTPGGGPSPLLGVLGGPSFFLGPVLRSPSQSQSEFRILHQGQPILWGYAFSDDALIAVATGKRLILRLYERTGKVVAERRVIPQTKPPTPSLQAFSISQLIGRKPQAGTYRIVVLDEKGKSIGSTTVRIGVEP